MKFREKLRLGIKGNNSEPPDEPFESELAVIQEEAAYKVIDVGNGFTAMVVYRTEKKEEW